MQLTSGHYWAIFLTLGLVLLVGASAVRKVKGSKDFTMGGNQIGTAGVIGILLGTILGGASTIGTSQLAFSKGISAVWFSLGCSVGLIGIAILSPRLCKIPRVNTIPQILCRRYGKMIRPIIGITAILGIFFSIVASNLSMIDILATLLKIELSTAYFVLFLFIIFYVLFGGILGASWIGLIKTILLYIVLIWVGFIALEGLVGEKNLLQTLPANPTYNVFVNGFFTDIATFFSVIVGVMSTQTYFQVCYSTKDMKKVRQGYLWAAALVVPISIPCISVGLFMKSVHPEILPVQALPYFLIEYLPTWIGGIGIAALVLSGLGTASGLILGLTTIISQDFVDCFIPTMKDKKKLYSSRSFIVVTAGVSVLFSAMHYGSQILSWNYLSLGLRGAGIFLPLLAALYFPRKISPIWGVISTLAGTMTMFSLQLFTRQGINSLWYGLVLSGLCLIIGFVKQKNKNQRGIKVS